MQLIYVDRTACPLIDNDRTERPISFWTKDVLSRRETFELSSGGFGNGEIRDLYVEIEKTISEEQCHEATDFDIYDKDNTVGKIASSSDKTPKTPKTDNEMLDDTLSAIITQGIELKNEIVRKHTLNPDDEKLQQLIERYNKTFLHGIFTRNDQIDASNKVLTVLADIESPNIKLSRIEQVKKHKTNKKSKDLDVPQFNLLSDSSQETLSQDISQKGSPVKETPENMKWLETIDLNTKLDELELKIWKYLMATVIIKKM